jgi:hypothetical protein
MSRKSVSVKSVPSSNAQKARSRREKARQIQHLILQELGCSSCGCLNWYLLEYHHIDKKRKTGNISTLASQGALSKMAVEFQKCAVLCCNCHRLVERNQPTGPIVPVPLKKVRWAFRQVDEVFPSLI